MKPMIRTILAALALALAIPAAAQNWTQTTPISNGVLRTGFNAAGYQISNLGNVTFVSEEALDALREQLGIANLTISQLNDPLAENAWALRASDGSFQINGGERRVEFRRELGLEEDGPSSRADGGGPVFSARHLTDVSVSFPATSHPERMWFNNGVVEFDSTATRDAFRTALAIPASNNATALTTGTLAAARLPTITLNTSGVLHASPITLTAGTGNMTLQPQSANTVLAGPTSGNATAPTFRALTSGDLPGNATLSGNVSITGPTITGNASAPPALSIDQTWNTTGAPTAVRLNVTESQTPSTASLLLDLQRGGVSRAAFRRDGLLLNTGFRIGGTQGGVSEVNVGRIGIFSNSAQVAQLLNNVMMFGSTTVLSWSTNIAPSNENSDTGLFKNGAGSLVFASGSIPHAIAIANTWNSTADNERISIGWSGNVASIGPAAAGNGTLRPLTLTGSTVTVPGNTVLGDAAADTVTVNAATLKAPNASGATADAVMTRTLTDARFLWRLSNWSYRERDLVFSPLSPGVFTFSVNASVSSGGAANGNALTLSTNATQPGNATATGLIPGNFLGNGPNTVGDNVLVWNRPMVLWLDIIAEAWRAGNTARVYWGQPETWRSGPMTANGVGFEITGATARGAVRNSTTATTTTTAAMVGRRNYRLAVTLNGTVAEFFVNGVSLGTLAVPSGTNVWPNQQAVAALENDGSAAATYLILSRTGAGFLLEP